MRGVSYRFLVGVFPLKPLRQLHPGRGWSWSYPKAPLVWMSKDGNSQSWMVMLYGSRELGWGLPIRDPLRIVFSQSLGVSQGNSYF